MSALRLADSAGVTTDTEGNVERRREALGLTKSRLAALALVDRGTLDKIEAGKPVTQTKLDQVLAALDKVEFEYGLDGEDTSEPASAAEPTPRVVTFEARGVFGVSEISVAGPVEDQDALAEKFTDIITKLSQGIRPE